MEDSDIVDDGEPSPVKIFKNDILSLKSTVCLICGKRCDEAGLRKPTEKGLETFIKSLKIRKTCNGFNVESFARFIDFENNKWLSERESVYWHSTCYSSYTNSKNLKVLSDQKFNSESPCSSSTSDKRKTRNSKPVLNIRENCLFCGFKKFRNDKKLITLQYQSVIDKIQKKCKELNDFEFESTIGVEFNNLPAYDAKYHSYCLQSYLQKKKSDCSSISIHKECFKELVPCIDTYLTEGRAVKLTDLLEQYKAILRDNGYPNYDAYTCQGLKNYLIQHYGESISFADIPGKKQMTQYVYSSTISIPDVINIAAEYKLMIKNRDNIDINAHAADIILKDIQKISGIEIHPLDPDSICQDIVLSKIPKSLETFLEDLCGKEKHKKKKILSIAQDIIHVQSNGKKRMPKQVGLGLSLKHSLRSKEYITLLNSLGHCISYDDVLRIDSTWAANIMELNDGFATVPTNIKPNVFAQAASDNGDYGQENNSQHVTNTVLYQYNEMNGRFSNVPRSRKPTQGLRRSIDVPNEQMYEINILQPPDLPSYYKSRAQIIINEQPTSNSRILSSSLTTMWVLLRLTGNKVFVLDCDQKVPNWTGFRKLTTLKVTTPTTIGNCRTIPASPTDFNVVYTMMINVKKILRNIGQEDPCVTLDESIYEIAKQIQWNQPHLDDMTIRLGGFHRAKNFLGIIGKRMKFTGLSEVLEAAEIFGSNQIEGILDGRHFNRGMTSHKIMVDALMRLFWIEFEKWLEKEDHAYRMNLLNSLLAEVHSLIDVDKDIDKVMLQNKVEALNDEFKALGPLIKHFRMNADSQSDTFKFWMEYCDMIYLLLDFMAAERQSDWLLHLETFREMLYYDRAYDHYKYFRWGIIYLCDMDSLRDTHPNLHQEFLNGNHSVSRSKTDSSFNAVSTDMALEQSLNKDSKVKGGIIGVSHDQNAVEKWTLTSHLYSAVINNFREACGVNQSQEDKSLSKTTTRASENAVIKVINAIKLNSNPFELPSSGKKVPLRNIVSGHLIEECNRHEVLEAKSIGKESTEMFVKQRMIDKTIPYWDPIRKLNITTFGTEVKPIKIINKKDEKIKAMKYNQNIFSRLLTVSGTRKVDVKNVLSYELAPVPLSLFHPTGEMRKIDKSQLMKELEATCQPLQHPPGKNKLNSAVVVDFMASIQTLRGNLKTFGDVETDLQTTIHRCFRENSIAVIVPDRYDWEVSIKSSERSKRQNQKKKSAEIYINSPAQLLPKDFKSYLSNSKNKTRLVEFIFASWASSLSTSMVSDEHLFLANVDGTTTHITKEGSTTIPFSCNHEEADTKMIAYCKYIVEQYRQINRIVIMSPDTDVAVIACHHYATNIEVDEMWFHTGVAKNKRFIPIHEVCKSLEEDVCATLPAFHALTGCDTVSAFSGITKKPAFTVLKKYIQKLPDLKRLGSSPTISLDDDAIVAAVRFVCLLYDKQDEVDINLLRYKLFARKNLSGEKLPPTLTSLTLHIQRANYQSFIWRSAHVPEVDLPSPVGNGWIMVDNEICLESMAERSAPEVVVELTTCRCSKGCSTNVCSCRKSVLSCTDACGCEDECQNSINHQNSDDDSDCEDEI